MPLSPVMCHVVSGSKHGLPVQGSVLFLWQMCTCAVIWRAVVLRCVSFVHRIMSSGQPHVMENWCSSQQRTVIEVVRLPNGAQLWFQSTECGATHV